MAKKEIDWQTILVILIVIFLVFGQRPISAGQAAMIAKESLLNDPIIGSLKARVNLDLLDVSDQGKSWQVQVKLTCQRNAERICAPSELSDRGIVADYTVFVDKSTGEAIIVYPYFSTQD